MTELFEVGLALILGGVCCYAFAALFGPGKWGEKKVVVRGFSEVLLALILGGISCLLFLSLVGIIAVLDIDNKYFEWTTLLPKYYRRAASWVHAGLIEVISAIPAILATGVPLGILIRKRPYIFGFMAFIGFLIFFVTTIYRVWADISVWYYPIWLGALRIVSWTALFGLGTSLGFHIRKRKNQKYLFNL